MKKQIQILIYSAKINFIIIIIITFFINYTYAAKVNKEIWVNNFKEKFSSFVCNSERSKSILVDKYGISVDKCTQLMKHAVSLCIESYDEKIPPILNLPKDGQKLGGIVGSCSQKVYELSLKHKIR